MDLAYDHITEQSLPKDEGNKEASGNHAETKSTLNADFQAAYSALSANPWANRIGGFFGSVVKQGGSVYQEAQKEVTALGQDAAKGLSGLQATLAQRTRNLSVTTAADAKTDATRDPAATPTAASLSSTTINPTTGSQEDSTVLARFKDEAGKRLRDLQRAEDAADEALIKFGSNIRDFLKDAVSIAPPAEGDAGAGGSGSGSGRLKSGDRRTLLFESKDAQGKRTVHASRFDAQLHVIHSNPDSFAKDPSASAEYTTWSAGFDIAKKTDDIAGDLNKYPELRTTMEKLVPDAIPYADFWQRYYFLRHGIETAEARRRDLLRAASAEEEIGWDEDSDDEESDANAKTIAGKAKTVQRPASTESSTTILPPAAASTSTTGAGAGLLKPGGSPRRSNDEKSQADSESSYDIVGAKSGAPSQAPNSPRETQKVDEDSEEEDWE